MADGGKGAGVEEGALHYACRLRHLKLEDEVVRLRRKLQDLVGEAPECPFCLEAVNCPVELQSCRHLFCCECFFSYAYASTPENRVCPVCRASITTVLPVRLAFIELLERVKKEIKRQEEEEAASGGERKGSSGGKSGGRVADAAARPTVGESAGDEDRNSATALAGVAARTAESVPRQTYNSQGNVLKNMFGSEQEERGRKRRRDDARVAEEAARRAAEE